MLAWKIKIKGKIRNFHKIGKVNLRDLGIRAFDESLEAHMEHDTNHAD